MLDANLTRDVQAFCAELNDKVERGECRTALQDISDFVAAIVVREAPMGHVFSSRDLDAVCLAAGKKLMTNGTEGQVNEDCTVFIVSGIAESGGHTRVLLDLWGADPALNKVLLVSNVKHALTEAAVQSIFESIGEPLSSEVAPVREMDDVVRWLQTRLRELRPARTYLLQHHFDAPAIAAVQPELAGDIVYFHHCDHNLALGVHIPNAIHVDFNSKSAHNCKYSLGVERQAYWPLVAEVRAQRPDRPFLAAGRLRTATSGGALKFDNALFGDRIPYLYDYRHILPLILKTTGGPHVHIGAMPENVIAEIRAELVSLGVDPDNFIHIPWVDDVASELINRGIDLYVGSFPRGGGRATVEIMGAGFPLLLHHNYISPFFSDICETYEGVLQWRNERELVAILSTLDATTLKDHALRARRFYETNLTPSHLEAAVHDTLRGVPWSPPHEVAYTTDNLQHYLDRIKSIDVLTASIQALRAEINERENVISNIVANIETIEKNITYFPFSIFFNRKIKYKRALIKIKKLRQMMSDKGILPPAS